METLLATVGGGAAGAEQNTIWALVWTQPEPAGHARTHISFHLARCCWAGEPKDHWWRQMSVT